VAKIVGLAILALELLELSIGRGRMSLRVLEFAVAADIHDPVVRVGCLTLRHGFIPFRWRPCRFALLS
jgi:hypothetical protein